MNRVAGTFLVVMSLVFHGQLVAQEEGAPGDTSEKDAVIHLDQNKSTGWDDSGRNWYHHATQGAYMIPYELFMALELPTEDESGLFSSMKHLEKFGFLTSEPNKIYNPGNLPVGFAISDNWVDPNHPDSAPVKALGFTCAACHTGEVRYQGKRIRIEGGSAMIDLSGFQKELAAAVFITNSKSDKFDRLADRILGPKNLPLEIAEEEKKKIKKGLEATITKGLRQKELEARMGVTGIASGYSRTDALSRIGNSVFGKLDPINLQSVGAPVNYPHIWDTPWYDWVQYNGSIRLPMVRNIGEALGLGAVVKVTTDGDDDPTNHESTVNIVNLHKMEKYLAGDKPFSGLKAPAWPEEILGEIEGFHTQNGKWAKGRDLFATHCIRCHHLNEDYKASYNNDKPNDYWTEKNKWNLRFMKTPMVNIVDIGTDSAMALDFYRRIVYTGAGPHDEDARQIMPAVEALTIATVKVRNKAYADMNLSPEQQDDYDGYREMPNPDNPNSKPGAIAPLEYKARPLDGIWATAPYLHNGSVPNLYELLLPVAERSSSFYLGSTEFDPKHVGFETKWTEGKFRMDTNIPGNHNTGHEFRNFTAAEEEVEKARKLLLNTNENLSDIEKNEALNRLGIDRKPAVHGRVGPLLTDEERFAIIEYVKSLGSQIPTSNANLNPPVFEKTPEGEEAAIQGLGALLGQIQQGTHAMKAASAEGKPVLALRGQHPKNHGAVRATFRVEPDRQLPDEARVGLFRELKAFSAWIRFSNGNSFDDADTDVHGMAIKVLMPDATDPAKTLSQDFITADHPIFFAKDVQHLKTFLEATATWERAKMTLADNKVARDEAFSGYIQAMQGFPLVKNFKSYPKPSPLEASYWSQTPYRLGPMHAVKYSVTPSPSNVYVPGADRSKENFLKEAMVEQLTNQMIPVSFDFWVQLFNDQKTTPIEDPTVRWQTPRIKVATITIYPQKFDSEEDMDFCEQLSFSPWQGLPDHAPLGGINRARKPIYAESSRWRHELNKTEQKEPSRDE